MEHCIGVIRYSFRNITCIDDGMNNQISMFDLMYSTYKIKKEIKLITLFSGYDSQALALKYLGIPFIHHKTCEWAVKSIQALKDMHFENDNNDYSKDLTEDEVKDYLFKKGISSNYNDPMSESQIKRLTEKQVRTIYNNIQASHNLVNIQQVKADDLEITETDKYTYIMTYSFPCQDISAAGLKNGFDDTSTRSGMLWEVERILKECKNKPEVLIMENVPLIHSESGGNLKNFNKWILSLEEMGYSNYWQDLSATDFEIPQTRIRTFMVSILGEWNYKFPKPKKLDKKLKDFLEDVVDDKYFLSKKMIDGMTNTNFNSYKLDHCLQDRGGNINTLTTSTGSKVPLLVRDIPNTLKIKNKTKKGYLEAEVGDGIDISSRMQHHRGTVQKGKSQTITTMGGNNIGVIVND